MQIRNIIIQVGSKPLKYLGFLILFIKVFLVSKKNVPARINEIQQLGLWYGGSKCSCLMGSTVFFHYLHNSECSIFKSLLRPD